ncbi:hypothetical protein HS088_TW01G00244 [Tripterygium wilfordii]|uniref:Protein kinase domain-containing protein n=1 Tax=Tripterygium wilfordii TaxID=458696 RepID=A0A7J7E209_TRIWF|nr:uncharacterized protein LOC119997159 [Tripterygium wilfordii]KAF5752336.1 hypothetical protein HS088_TW01G00244 [Tripterygium wilfordii]
MQLQDPPQTILNSPKNQNKLKSSGSSLTQDGSHAADVISTVVTNRSGGDSDENLENELVLDVSGKSSEFSLLDDSDENVEGLYVYRNVFNLLPKSVGALPLLRTLKFFGNEINLFPPEFGDLVGLECLQVKVSSPELNGFGLRRLQGLKELELSRVPPRPSVFTILSEISGLKCLSKLAVCHFSIRYLPPEIGCLNNLEYLDLSFNKIKTLPAEISYLKALISLKVANNKLVEVPSILSSLQKLENLDFSYNRLTSLGGLELQLMRSLQTINLQYNKLLTCCQIPSWICCNLDGNGKDSSNDDFISSSVEMDVYETSNQDDCRSSCDGPLHSTSSLLTPPSSNSQYSTHRRFSKRWKRQHYLQQRARLERLNNSRKWKGDVRIEVLTMKASEDCKLGSKDVVRTETCEKRGSDITVVEDDKQVISGPGEGENLLVTIEDDDINSKEGSCELISGPGEGENLLVTIEDDDISSKEESCEVISGPGEGENSLVTIEDDDISPKEGSCGGNCLCVEFDSVREGECCVQESLLASRQNETGDDEGSSSELSKSTTCKRHSDRDLDNPKPCKSRKSTDDSLSSSRKYSHISFCGIEDRLLDGFYDAGRDRPFMALRSYEQILPLDSREVILLDRGRDEGLDAITLSAQALVFRLKQFNSLGKIGNEVAVDNLQIASLLALFVSDHFGGSDRSSMVERSRKAVSGSNYSKPFVCTCSTGNKENINAETKQILDTVDDIIFSDLCEKSLCNIKARRNSVVVPLGTLQSGVCRHRALLFKYLCDRMDPPVPCELVRGYLDFLPHAWNTILVKRRDSMVRMVVDACHPHDIREETDPEYFSRYIPLSRANVPMSGESIPGPGCSFPSLSTCDVIEKATSRSLLHCKLGSVEAAVKVHTLEVGGSLLDEIKSFEYSCLGEVRILGALRHPYVVELYGHKISSKWVPSTDGNPERRILESAIFMEFIKGGSLKGYLEKLSKAGEKRVPVDLALCIARDVACALMELHSKHIIHRDIKSENILIDLDKKRADGKPLVKLCDFDRAVPLRSLVHTCCIAHRGIPPPDICVGTPRWMAPEVFRTMQDRNIYGLEVDIWSYGCLLLELLTLQVPYLGLSDLQIHDHLQRGKRPQLTNELEALVSMNEPTMAQSDAEVVETEPDQKTLTFLVDLFHHCTEENPVDRLTAEELYELLLDFTSTFDRSERSQKV